MIRPLISVDLLRVATQTLLKHRSIPRVELSNETPAAQHSPPGVFIPPDSGKSRYKEHHL
jgi:hypothetical protein